MATRSSTTGNRSTFRFNFKVKVVEDQSWISFADKLQTTKNYAREALAFEMAKNCSRFRSSKNFKIEFKLATLFSDKKKLIFGCLSDFYCYRCDLHEEEHKILGRNFGSAFVSVPWRGRFSRGKSEAFFCRKVGKCFMHARGVIWDSSHHQGYSRGNDHVPPLHLERFSSVVVTSFSERPRRKPKNGISLTSPYISTL